MAGGYLRQGLDRAIHTGARDTGRVQISRRTAGFLVAAGAWPLVIWPNFVRVVATDERAFADGRPTAYLVVHATLAAVSMGLGLALVLLGARAWRRTPRH